MVTVGRFMRVELGRFMELGLRRVLTVAAVLVSLGAATPAGASGVVKVRFGGDQQQTRVVLELDHSTRGKLLSGETGDQMVLALPGIGVSDGLDGQGQGLVRTWSVDRVAGAARVELRLTREARVVRRFILAPTDGMPNYRYVVDLAAVGPVDAAALVKVSAHVSARLKKVVVIDAGHGGKDPGALGKRSYEKDITLAATRALKKRLERDGRYRVVLTRSRDEFVPLEERVQIARRADADLFISLHADAGASPDIHGATVYTLSDKGSERVARKVIDNDGFMNVSLPGRDRAVNQILLDLTQRATKNSSSAFAELLVDKIGGETSLVERSRRDAGYVVLLAPDVPAVLLEMGFITSPRDEAGMEDAAHRARLMNAVGDSIDGYFLRQTRTASR